MKTSLLFAALAIFGFVIASPAVAQTYSLGYDQTRYNVQPDDTVDIDVILRERITGAEVARLAPGGDNGLFSFSLAVDYSVFSGGTNGSTYSSLVLDPLFTTGFSGSGEDITDDPGIVSFEGAEDFLNNDSDGEFGAGGTQIDANNWEIKLATLTFAAGDVGTTTTIEIKEHVSPMAAGFRFADDATPDINIVNEFSSGGIVVVPEPGSAGLIALLAGAGFLRRRRS